MIAVLLVRMRFPAGQNGTGTRFPNKLKLVHRNILSVRPVTGASDQRSRRSLPWAQSEGSEAVH